MPQWYITYRIPILFLQIAAGILIFTRPLNRRRHFRLRFFLGCLGGMVLLRAAQLLVHGGQALPSPSIWRTIFSFAASLLAILLTYFCHRESVWTILFISSSGGIAQNMAGTFKTLLRLIPALEALGAHPLGVLAVDLLAYGGMYLTVFAVTYPLLREREVDFDNRLKALFAILTLLFTVGMSRLTVAELDQSVLTVTAESIYQIVCGLLLLFLQFAVIGRARLNRNVAAMQELIHTQHNQFLQSKESVELVNEKYHDLKGLLDGFQGQVSAEQVACLREKVREYDVFVNTGNKVLDIVIAEKRTICNQRGIELTVLLDGTALDFMEELDLYSLISNVLNNAIDAVSKLPKGDRFIILTAASRGNLVTIHGENPNSGALVMENGLPQSQRDRHYHGFGMKSIRHVAEKYGGNLAVASADGIFSLDVILLRP